ncbi:MAG: hydantoinase B/oxoprolinase family protein [Candidatus Bathyarchaeia archaeon]|nr:hydantoinase B/oxoprolinase family protein [Candidatus Bathyarchaeota archaeon]
MMGIGYGGKTLKELLEENVRLFKETGCYYGIKELTLRKEDPVKLERFSSRLLSLVVGARESVRYIASSPGTKEVGELVFAIFTPEGDGVVFSTGIMAHVNTLSRFIKWMIERDYESDPGIVEGRYFEANDWWVGGLHPVDVLQVTPIFYNGQLIGWCGGVIHELEAGAYEPAGCPLSPTRFLEGVHLMGDIVGENDKLKKEYVEKMKVNVRMPEIFIMDAKVRLSGNYMIREGVKKVIEEFGIDYYMRAVRELIEEGRRAFLEKVKLTLIPGKYRTAAFIPLNYGQIEGLRRLHPLAQQDTLLQFAYEIKVNEDGTLDYDFYAANPQGPHPLHATPTLLRGGLWITLTQILAYDLRVSEGTNLCVSFSAPPGSTLNPTDPHVSTSNVWNVLCTIFGSGVRLLSQGFFARGFLEEIFQMNANDMHAIQLLDVRGGLAGGDNMEHAGAGSGARAVEDGLDAGHCLWLPDTTAGNAERWEELYNELYLYRSFLKDVYAPGRFRGGVARNSSFIVWTDFMQVVFRCGWTPGVFPFDKGMFGGYPPPTPFGYALRNTNVKELIEKGLPLPRNVFEILDALNKGILKADEVYFYKTHDVTPRLKHYDIFGIVHKGGAGYGDPIKRDPKLVLRDIGMGLVSPEYAERIHGVVLKREGDKWTVDIEATLKKREAIKSERLAKAIPVKDFIEQERKRILDRNIPEHVLRCYRDCMRISQRFKEEFYRFWNLNENFEL